MRERDKIQQEVMFVTECDLNGYDAATKLGGEK